MRGIIDILSNFADSLNTMQFIKPTWPAPKNICAFTTTRQNGSSLPPFMSFNLAHHVGDAQHRVEQNRQLLIEQLGLPTEPVWLQQVHSAEVLNLSTRPIHENPIADAAITRCANIVCSVMTADCLPILICNKAGTLAGAIHAGWRGLANGIIENTVKAINEATEDLLVWLGPAIGPNCFEVSNDVLEIFVAQDRYAALAFKQKEASSSKWLADIYLLAKQRFNTLGITAITGGDFCTYSDEQNFYSYRRDGVTGRMATLIWLSA